MSSKNNGPKNGIVDHKVRNVFAMHAILRNGAGAMKDKRTPRGGSQKPEWMSDLLDHEDNDCFE